jgi:hypothetical protein
MEDEMPIVLDTFVDTHCHMFTAADVPIHATIKRSIKHPLAVLFGGVAARAGFANFERFLMYFDSESIENVRQVVNEMEIALGHTGLAHLQIDAREKILTPLVMDFDTNGNVCKFEGQLRRLVDAAKAHRLEGSGSKVKVLPFVGLDPRKLVYQGGTAGPLLSVAEIKTRVEGFLRDHEVVDSDTRRDRDSLVSGDVIGVKLYPPLGFQVHPEDVSERAAYLAVYEKLAELEVPITVHCQQASYNLSGSAKDEFTTPENWAKVLRASPTLANLRINFGHFGGEQGAAYAIRWDDPVPDDPGGTPSAAGPSHHGWTTRIIKLLKQYDHTYADISAFDYGSQEGVSSLLWILAYDEAGEFDESGGRNHKLKEKLMWGSDYPMFLEKKFNDYPTYFGGFVKNIIHRHSVRETTKFPIPDEVELPEAEGLLRGMTGENPVRFLFG